MSRRLETKAIVTSQGGEIGVRQRKARGRHLPVDQAVLQLCSFPTQLMKCYSRLITGLVAHSVVIWIAIDRMSVIHKASPLDLMGRGM
jgi:hypothetical protein